MDNGYGFTTLARAVHCAPAMHYFDPTLDWPQELLDEPMPDLVIVHSRSLTDANAPWRGADKLWTTEWAQYASADGDQHFINMIFLKGSTSSDNDRKEVAAYLDKLVNDGASVHRYRSATSRNDLSTLSTAPVIRCGPEIPGNNTPRPADTWPPDWTSRFTLLGYAGPVPTSHQPWQSMRVEPVTEAGPDSAREQGAYATPPVNEHGTTSTREPTQGETKGIILYIVGSSAGLRQEESFDSTFEWTTALDDMTIW